MEQPSVDAGVHLVAVLSAPDEHPGEVPDVGVFLGAVLATSPGVHLSEGVDRQRRTLATARQPPPEMFYDPNL